MKNEFLKKFEYKILNHIEIKKKYSGIKNKSIILCHGVFDIVHPGHIRHLIYAKSKSDILVVSITSDKFIEKGKYRPHVPQSLRALNLAAFEMVDHVIIDNNKTPMNLIKSLKPKFFAKGFEYSSKIPKSTIEEKKLVESHGGQMLFTPGDIVYSSSKLLNEKQPNLSIEKLSLLMSNHKITFDLIKKTIDKFKNFHVHVFGDTIIDTYTRTSFIGGQTKTPTFSVLYDKHEDYLGGAGIVSKHLRAAGAKVDFTTVLGQDDFAKFVKKDLKKNKINLNLITDPTRPTTNKNVIINGNYRLLKLDKLDNRPVSQEIQKEFSKYLKNINADAVILSDFRHGIFNKDSIPSYLKSIPKKMFKVADSQVASRWGNITEFKNFDLITPNERESRFALADQDSTVSSLADSLVEVANCKNLILKLSERGVFCLEKNKNKKSFFTLDSFAKQVVDSVGSGDALLAYSTLSFLVSNSIVIASIIGSIAAACECEFDGNIPIKKEIVIRKINELEKEINFL
jgi:rfaE bifunctional protein kinase chain/domain/rfaE bifunctional protein nucleotidyltransferase chain/domain|tara:strand:- start:940 stop:2478 length:1539 start_codon:yes stop_codon:yes gene_type:complete